MQATPVTPTRLVIDCSPEEEAELRKLLTYKDKKVTFSLMKLKKNRWLADRIGVEQWQDQIRELKAQESKCLVFQDSKELWTYPGLIPTIKRKFPHLVVHPPQYPIPEVNPFWTWDKVPEHTPYPYQLSSKDLLLDVIHGGVEIGTGLGKSLIILLLIRHLGLRTVVMAPGESVANQLYDDLVRAFGSKHVGFYGDGKKVSKKRITVAIGASLTRIKPGTPAWKDLSQTQCFVADESHLCPAATLENVCHGLVANAPWRFFFSATQMREDGLDLLLQAITGPIVFRMTVKEGIEQGYLARLFFYLVKIQTQINSESRDPNEDTRDHLYYNPDVNRKAGQLATYFTQKENCRILILIKELEQFKSGKTVYIYDTIGTMHEDDPEGIALRFDTEYRDEAQLTVKTAPLYGIDLDRYQCIQSNNPEDIYNQVANKIEPMLKDGLPLRILALDSMNGVQGVRAANGEMDIMKQQIGDVAKTNKEGLKAVLELQRKYKFAVMMTSHVAIEMDPQEQKRGNHFKMGASVGVQHHAEYTMFFEPIKGKAGASDNFGNLLADETKLDSQGWKDQTAHRIRCTMKGASMGGGTGRHGQFTFAYKGGIINQHEEVHILGKNRGVIYHPAKDEKSAPNPQMWAIRGHPLVPIRGEENFVNWLKTDQEAQKFILDDLRAQDRDGRSARYDAADFAAHASQPEELDESQAAE